MQKKIGMKKNIIFIQGGGENGYIVDAKLVSSLQNELGSAYDVHYPKMQTNESLPDFGWLTQIAKEVSLINDSVILAGHSLGASMLLKYISENKVQKKITGIFLISTPYWSGNEDWVRGLKLKENFTDNLPKNVPIFFYHNRDDEEIPYDQFAFYRQKIPWATFQEKAHGGHQFDNNLSSIAKDIKSL